MTIGADFQPWARAASATVGASAIGTVVCGIARLVRCLIVASHCGQSGFVYTRTVRAVITTNNTVQLRHAKPSSASVVITGDGLVIHDHARTGDPSRDGGATTYPPAPR